MRAFFCHLREWDSAGPDWVNVRPVAKDLSKAAESYLVSSAKRVEIVTIVNRS